MDLFQPPQGLPFPTTLYEAFDEYIDHRLARDQEMIGAKYYYPARKQLHKFLEKITIVLEQAHSKSDSPLQAGKG